MMELATAGLAAFVLGLALGGAFVLICNRKPKQPKILTADNQGAGRQVIPLEVWIFPGENGLTAAVVNPETGEKISFAGCSAAVWQQAIMPGADRCLVVCRLEQVPVRYQPGLNSHCNGQSLDLGLE